MDELDLGEVCERVTNAAQAWAPGSAVRNLATLEGGTVGLVYSADVLDGPPEHSRLVLKVAPPGLPIALAPELRSEVARPQAALPHLGLEPLDDRAQRLFDAVVREPSEQQVERFDLLPDEVVHPVELGLELRFGGEVPRHVGVPPGVSRARRP